MLRPSVSALTSRRATSGQGIAMGLNNAFMSLGRIAGPVLAGALFEINLNLPYLIGALIMALGLIISLIWLERQAPNSTTEPVTSVHSQQPVDN
jgi:DHA1 family multidrug resistance protein-like MFS transporter